MKKFDVDAMDILTLINRTTQSLNRHERYSVEGDKLILDNGDKESVLVFTFIFISGFIIDVMKIMVGPIAYKSYNDQRHNFLLYYLIPHIHTCCFSSLYTFIIIVSLLL